ncbi:anti-sigma B factor antagonist [Micromonospora palomenae]|uniref:Anti-sigma factor antagonist n=1 Tax=Micromonospora palomenae TaxID=1461247 RepID=A0A561VHD9_9ACTN|nr:STAS domain-containing protein [Micromonospora palomenae]TWG11029.1 anti-sigma B factor antagonist [Micromonospora palomenae]
MRVDRRHEDGGRIVLRPVGDLDIATAAVVQDALDAALDLPDTVELVVDLTEVPFLDSTGVAALLRGAAEAVGRGASLRVVDPQPVVARVLRITGVDSLVGLAPRHRRPSAVDPDAPAA